MVCPNSWTACVAPAFHTSSGRYAVSLQRAAMSCTVGAPAQLLSTGCLRYMQDLLMGSHVSPPRVQDHDGSAHRGCVVRRFGSCRSFACKKRHASIFVVAVVVVQVHVHSHTQSYTAVCMCELAQAHLRSLLQDVNCSRRPAAARACWWAIHRCTAGEYGRCSRIYAAFSQTLLNGRKSAALCGACACWQGHVFHRGCSRRGFGTAVDLLCGAGDLGWGPCKVQRSPERAARGSPASEAGDGLTLPGNGLRCVLVAREVTMTGLSSSTWLAALQAPPKRVRLMPEVEPVSLPPVVDLGRASKEENPPAPMLSTGLEEWNEADRTGTRRPVSQPKPGECVRWGSSSRMRPREGSNAVGKHSDAQLALAANRHELLAWRMPEATGLPVPRRLRGGQAGITSSEDWDRHMTVSCVQSNGADSDVQEGIGSGWLSSSEPRPCFDSWEPASGTGASVSCSALKPGVAPVSELEVGAPLGV